MSLRRMFFLMLIGVLCSSFVLAQGPSVTLDTSMGTVVIELFSEKSPKTVANFLSYVRAGHYDGTIFHRVIPNFMVQGGGFDAQMTQKGTKDPVQNESKNGLPNTRGTLAMARTRDPHSATAQFFINTVDNPALDAAKSQNGWGYAVFGKVTEGMDVVDALSAVKTATKGGHGNVPVEVVVIRKATVKE